MLGYIEIVLIYFFLLDFLYQGKERPAKKILVPEKLCAVLANFRFPEDFQKINMWGLVFHRFSFLFFDSVQCKLAQSLTPRSISLRRVTYFANISSKTNF